MLYFLLKNYNHSVEWYYASVPNEKYFIQYLKFTDEELSDKTYNLLNLNQHPQLVDEVEDFYGIYDVEDDFDYILNCNFHNFFNELNVDIPKCFKKTISPKRFINNLDILKFNNYFMFKGFRYKSLRSVLESFNHLNLVYTRENRLKSQLNSWKFYYSSLTSLVFKKNYYFFDFVEEFELYLRGSQFQTLRKLDDIHDIFVDFIKKLLDVLPIFSFYVYKVDKRIYKNTRGRSGKYTFIWKYVAPYKRLYLVLFWLVRELKVSQGKSYADRVYTTLYNFFFNLNKTWIFRIKKFSHNYVYKNCRLTLAENYITSTK